MCRQSPQRLLHRLQRRFQRKQYRRLLYFGQYFMYIKTAMKKQKGFAITSEARDWKQGFTLIELLIVVLLIGILSAITLSLINTTGLRSKSRDSRRIADIKKIQTALELYFADFRVYPVSAGCIRITGSDALNTALVPNYANALPVDPVQSGSDSTPCGNTTNYRYNYCTNAGGTEYVMTAVMEISTSNDISACGSLNNWSLSGCGGSFATSDVCYGAENP